MNGILRAFFKIFKPASKPEDALWHEFVPLLPRRMSDGTWASAPDKILRRKTTKGWEYKAIPEHDDDYHARQW